MEFLDQLTKGSSDQHHVPVVNNTTNRTLPDSDYPQSELFTKLVTHQEFDKLPTGSFLAELNDTKSESSVSFNDELFQCKQINDNSDLQHKVDSRIVSSTDYKLNTDCETLTSVGKTTGLIFPFVCGVCEHKFDNIPGYFEHMTLHDEVTGLLHCCEQSNVIDDTEICIEKSEIFSCGICKVMFPSLCTLYKHMITVEKVQDFVYKSSNKTVYAYKESENTCKVNTQSRTETKPYANKDDSKMVFLHNQPDKIVSVSLYSDKDINSDSFAEYNNKPVQRSLSSRNKQKGKKKIAGVSVINESKKLKKVNKTLADVKPKKSKRTEFHLTLDSSLEVDNSIEDGLVSEGEDVEFDDNDVNDMSGHCTDGKIATSPENMSTPTNLKDVLFPCEICGGFYKRQNLQKHRTTHDERTLACDQCPVVFKSQFRLNAHKKQVHVEEKRFVCDVCGKSFKAWPYLKQHRQTHITSRDILCPLCPMTFQYKALLRAHMVTHSDNKPHQCDQCDRTFKRVDRLNAHKRYFHSEERNFSCPQCNKTFKTRDTMNRHHRIHLPPNNVCQICGKGFVQKYNLKIHQKVHGIYDTSTISKPCDQILTTPVVNEQMLAYTCI